MELLNTKEAAQLLGVNKGTLDVWRCTQRYNLKYIKIGGAVRYRVEDVNAFIAERTIGGLDDE